jgi:outer membrane immunogenic protein
MKKFLLGTVGLVALGMAAPASAADLAARPYTKAPPMVAAIYDWSGFYIGANGGWGSSRKCWDLTQNGAALISPIAAEGCHDASGGTAGGQIGYRWQSSAFVFGLEAQGNWADFRGSNISLVPFQTTTTNQSKIDAFGLFTGQIGYAWNNALLYVKGGASITDRKYQFVTSAGGAVIADTGYQTRLGGTAGVGLEYGFTPNWSAAIEYDHIFENRHGVTYSTAVGPLTGSSAGGDTDLITARLNYRWGGPVVAKY